LRTAGGKKQGKTRRRGRLYGLFARSGRRKARKFRPPGPQPGRKSAGFHHNILRNPAKKPLPDAKKVKNPMKKVLDKGCGKLYYTQADRESGPAMDLENDTGRKKRKERDSVIPRV
jgi:hypothetical protein